jgi:hypothetical protein
MTGRAPMADEPDDYRRGWDACRAAMERATPGAIRPDTLRAYLRAHGWTRIGTDRGRGRIYGRGDYEAVVWPDMAANGYARGVDYAVRAIAGCEGRAPHLVLFDLHVQQETAHSIGATDVPRSLADLRSAVASYENDPCGGDERQLQVNTLVRAAKRLLHDTDDATDGAHPAWWRGHDHGARAATEAILRALDGTDDGTGTLACPELQRAREGILALRRERDALLRDLDARARDPRRT